MAVLYRKYRPQTFGEVLNQKYIIQTLKNQVLSGAVSHAYLFTGSRGVGKTSVARILAKAVNCQNQKDGEACGQCDVCKAVEAGSFLDLVEIDAASNTGVDNIRELIEHVKFSPSLGKYKVFIIDEVHMLSKGAFNALLKTLEEPPKHAIFILATTEINKVPATIISRTQRFDFRAYSASDLMPLLEKISKEEKVNFGREILELVAQNAEGSARDALSLLDKLMTLGEHASLEDVQQLLGITDIAVCESLLKFIVSGDSAGVVDFYEGLSERGLDYAIFNRDFLEYLRKVLMHKVSAGKMDFALAGQHLTEVKAFAEKLSANDLIFIIRLFLKSYKDLQGAPSAQVPLLVASLEAALKKNAAPARPLAATQAPKIEVSHQERSAQQPPEDPEPQITQGPVVTLEQVENFWPKVIAKVREANGPLASLLKNSPLLRVSGNKIILSVKFNFDKQSLENTKNISLICGCIEMLSGKKIGISGEVVKLETKDQVNAAEAITEALKVFGGELIE